MSKHFITFGNASFSQSRIRLSNEVRQLGVFDSIKSYTETDLMNDQHGEFISKNRRGYGYWIWKPYLIYKKLLTTKDDDILLYADACCKIYPQYKSMS